MGFLDRFFGQKNKYEKSITEEVATSPESLPIDEEDKIVVALAASIMAGKDKNNSHYHISSIKRIK